MAYQYRAKTLLILILDYLQSILLLINYAQKHLKNVLLVVQRIFHDKFLVQDKGKNHRHLNHIALLQHFPHKEFY